jgi:hypothetical protein
MISIDFQFHGILDGLARAEAIVASLCHDDAATKWSAEIKCILKSSVLLVFAY